MKKLINLAFLPLFIFVVSFSLISCDEEQEKQAAKVNTADSASEKTSAEQHTGPNRIAVIDTNKGIIKFELYEKRAPVTTRNFISLAKSNFYDGLKFHRYVPGFVVQGGDPKGDGTGGSEKTIPLETNPELKHVEGAVGMARSNDPNSASSQFYFTLAETPHLDNSYAVFGKVIEGMDIVKKLREGDKMKSIKIIEAEPKK